MDDVPNLEIRYLFDDSVIFRSLVTNVALQFTNRNPEDFEQHAAKAVAGELIPVLAESLFEIIVYLIDGQSRTVFANEFLFVASVPDCI
jgi:hypothetical protein